MWNITADKIADTKRSVKADGMRLDVDEMVAELRAKHDSIAHPESVDWSCTLGYWTDPRCQQKDDWGRTPRQNGTLAYYPR